MLLAVSRLASNILSYRRRTLLLTRLASINRSYVGKAQNVCLGSETFLKWPLLYRQGH